MINKLAFWIESIIEDEPFNEEIKTLVFEIKQNGKYYYLNLKGYEKEYSLNALAVFSLEAQFFDLLNYKTKGEEYLYNILPQYIDEAFSSKMIKYFCKDKKVYLKFNENIKYLFTV